MSHCLDTQLCTRSLLIDKNSAWITGIQYTCNCNICLSQVNLMRDITVLYVAKFFLVMFSVFICGLFCTEINVTLKESLGTAFKWFFLWKNNWLSGLIYNVVSIRFKRGLAWKRKTYYTGVQKFLYTIKIFDFFNTKHLISKQQTNLSH